MSADSYPPPPRLPSIPKPQVAKRDLPTGPPEDANGIQLMRDVRGACANLGEKLQALEVHLMRQELAILTEEHKTNQLREEFTALAEYVKKHLPPEAAE